MLRSTALSVNAALTHSRQVVHKFISVSIYRFKKHIFSLYSSYLSASDDVEEIFVSIFHKLRVISSLGESLSLNHSILCDAMAYSNYLT